MVRFEFRHELPFVTVRLYAAEIVVTIENVLLDTGSARCVFRKTDLETRGIFASPDDIVRTMRGVGGIESIIEKRIDALKIEGSDVRIQPFIIEMGGMDYGYGINGILGSDFFIQTGAVIDFASRTIR